ncbi:hypothetical protein [Mariniphaga sp.]|uniref:hypothetical protein n=1 Tax=Mariniphaga sp. TaxID=1954475 RepID=UPI003567DC68
MTTVIIDEKTTKGKSLLEFLKSFSDERFISIEKEPNETTKRAIRAAKEGKVTRTENLDDLMEKLNA